MVNDSCHTEISLALSREFFTAMTATFGRAMIDEIGSTPITISTGRKCVSSKMSDSTVGMVGGIQGGFADSARPNFESVSRILLAPRMPFSSCCFRQSYIREGKIHYEYMITFIACGLESVRT